MLLVCGNHRDILYKALGYLDALFGESNAAIFPRIPTLHVRVTLMHHTVPFQYPIGWLVCTVGQPFHVFVGHVGSGDAVGLLSPSRAVPEIIFLVCFLNLTHWCLIHLGLIMFHHLGSIGYGITLR